ncbi:hypothetical protein K438DRAFT_1774842 [Mycena galopus ATCC 62051]|nr:hypothetical protein K438DRAFT_1774842 [Mycena galopus ATCC 62051]
MEEQSWGWGGKSQVEKPGPRYLLGSSGMYNEGNTEGMDRDREVNENGISLQKINSEVILQYRKGLVVQYQALQNGKVKRQRIFIAHPSVDIMTPAVRGLAKRYDVPMLVTEATGEGFGVEDAWCKGSKQYEGR